MCGGSSTEFFQNALRRCQPSDKHISLLKSVCLPGHVDDLFPFFLRHAKQIFPMLDCMDDLRKISDLRLPPNWSVRASQVIVMFPFLSDLEFQSLWANFFSVCLRNVFSFIPLFL